MADVEIRRGIAEKTFTFKGRLFRRYQVRWTDSKGIRRSRRVPSMEAALLLQSHAAKQRLLTCGHIDPGRIDDVIEGIDAIKRLLKLDEKQVTYRLYEKEPRLPVFRIGRALLAFKSELLAYGGNANV